MTTPVSDPTKVYIGTFSGQRSSAFIPNHTPKKMVIPICVAMDVYRNTLLPWLLLGRGDNSICGHILFHLLHFSAHIAGTGKGRTRFDGEFIGENISFHFCCSLQ